MKNRIAVLLLISIIFVSGCTSTVECGYEKLPDIKINETVKNQYEAFDVIKTYIKLGTFETYGDKIDDTTRKATIDKLEYRNISFPNGTTTEAWILNDETGLDNNGNLYLKCHPL